MEEFNCFNKVQSNEEDKYYEGIASIVIDMGLSKLELEKQRECKHREIKEDIDDLKMCIECGKLL